MPGWRAHMSVTKSPRWTFPPLITEAYTPTFTALWWAAVRRIPESFGRSPCGSVVITHREQCSVISRRTSSPSATVLADPAVLDEPQLRSGRDDDVRPETPNLETAVRIQRAQPVNRRRGEQVHDGDVEECPGRQAEVKHGIPVVQAGDVRPVLLGCRIGGLPVALCFAEGHLAAECPGEDLRQIILLARHDGPIGKRDADRGDLRSELGRLDVGGPEVEEVAPFPGILRPPDLAGRAIHDSEVPIAEKTSFGDLGGVQLLAHHRFHRIAPQPDNRRSLILGGR